MSYSLPPQSHHSAPSAALLAPTHRLFGPFLSLLPPVTLCAPNPGSRFPFLSGERKCNPERKRQRAGGRTRTPLQHPRPRPPAPAHPAPRVGPAQAITHAQLPRPQPAASSDTHFPLLGGAEQVTGENKLRGFLSRVLPPPPRPHLGLVSVPPHPTGPQPPTSVAQHQQGTSPREVSPGVPELVQGSRQNGSSAVCELCDSGPAPGPC